jgi:hypothetical protein
MKVGRKIFVSVDRTVCSKSVGSLGPCYMQADGRT